MKNNLFCKVISALLVAVLMLVAIPFSGNFTVHAEGGSRLKDAVSNKVYVNVLSENGDPIVGAKMQIKRNESVQEEWITDGNVYEVSSFLLLDYTLHQVSAPDGYAPAEDINFSVDSKTYKVFIDGEEQPDNTITVYNPKSDVIVTYGSVTIHTKSANPEITDNNEWYELLGAQYYMKNIETEEVYKMPAVNAEGVATINDIPVGDYELWQARASSPKESIVPSVNGYLKNPNKSYFTMTKDNLDVDLSYVEGSSDPYEQMECLLQPLDYIHVTVMQKNDGEYFTGTIPMNGAQYAFFKADGTSLFTVETNENGFAEPESNLIGLPGFGDYYIIQMVPAQGFLLPSINRFDFTIDWNVGAVGHVVWLDFEFDAASSPSYSVRTVRGGGWELYDLYWDSISSSFFNVMPDLGRVTIYDKHETARSYILTNLLDGSQVEVPAPDENGVSTVLAVKPGKYELSEVGNESAGTYEFYVYDVVETILTGGSEDEIEAKEYQQVFHTDVLKDDVVEPEYPFAIMIQSSKYYYSGTQSLGDAEFVIFNADTNEFVKTIETRNITPDDYDYDNPFEAISVELFFGPDHGCNYGYAETTLPKGNYLIAETSAPEGFSCLDKEFYFTIGESDGSHFSYRYGTIIFPTEIDLEEILSKGGFREAFRYYADMMNQIPELGAIKVKRYCETDPNANLAGAIYTLKNVETEETFVLPATDSNGEAFMTALEPGNYVIYESKAPVGFLENDAEREITIEALNESEIEIEAIREIILPFEPIIIKPIPIKPIIVKPKPGKPFPIPVPIIPGPKPLPMRFSADLSMK